MDHIKHTNRVDFTNSNLSWGGSSKGIFKLASVLTMMHNSDEKYKNTFGLSQSVLAGNMYAGKKLLKQPPYLFQVSGSVSEQRIYRTFIPNKKKIKLPNWTGNNETFDTFGKPLFENFQLNIRNESARIMSGYVDVETFFPHNRFSAKVFFKLGNYSVCQEFPILHINVKHEVRMWQVETGPVLFPVINDGDSLIEYYPTFVHFNCFEKLDIFYDYPFGIRSVNLHGKHIIEDLPCTIELNSN